MLFEEINTIETHMLMCATYLLLHLLSWKHKIQETVSLLLQSIMTVQLLI